MVEVGLDRFGGDVEDSGGLLSFQAFFFDQDIGILLFGGKVVDGFFEELLVSGVGVFGGLRECVYTALYGGFPVQLPHCAIDGILGDGE